MKKLIKYTYLLLLILSAGFAKAQDTTYLNQDTATVNNNNLELQNMSVENKDSTIKMLYQQLQKVSENDKQNAQAIRGLLQGKELDNYTKYHLLKNNIINATQTYYLLNKKIIDLKSRASANNLDVFIASLNNPESKALGFAFSDKVIDLVKSIVLEGKADKSKRNEDIVNSTNSIINSPIFKSFTALTPPLGIANAVMTFFHSVSVNNKHINEENLKKFEQELNKYVVYYTSLNEGNQKFQYGLNFNRDQLNLLHDNMYDHLAFTASALHFKMPPKNEQTMSEDLNKFFLTFTKEKTEDFFNELEKKYRIPGTQKLDYEKLLRENVNLKEVNNQLEDLVLQTKRYENLYNEYFTLLDSYYSKVISSLEIARNNGIANKELVEKKEKEFQQLKTEAINDTKASINIMELKNNTDNIKYRYKIF